MSCKRPVTYVEWREVYRRELHMLGFSVFYGMMMRPPHDVRFVRVTRAVWYSLQRLRRLRKRLDAEHHAMDATFITEVLNMLGLDPPPASEGEAA